MRSLLTTIFVFSIASVYSQAWLKLPDFPSLVRDDGVAVVIGNKAYVGTGLDPISAGIEFKVFDFATQQWSALPNMPFTTERQYACAFGNDTALYVTCGLGPTGALTSTYKFSFTTQTWKAVAPNPGKGLIAAVCFQFGDKIILAGGKGNNDTINHQVWQYDIASDVWTQKNNLPFSPLWRAACSTKGNLGYQLGGIDSTVKFSKRLYVYNAQTDFWQLTDSMPVPKGRAYQAMQTRSNNLFVFGGFDSLNTYYNDAFIYNTTTNFWDAAPALPAAPRKGGMSFTDGQNFYYTCGINASGIRLNETWMTNMPLGIKNEALIESNVLLFPNPAQTSITLKFENEHQKIIQLFDSNGSLALESVCRGGLQQIELLNLKPGIYFFKITSENEPTKTLKFSLLPNN